MSDVPLVSIITSLYDEDAYIETFLENITTQSIFEKCELLIIDADSPGNEYSVIEPYLAKFDNIFYERLDDDPGIYEVWNYAIRKSRGKYITNANPDDARLTTHIERCVEVMEDDTSVDVVSTAVYAISQNEKFEYARRSHTNKWFMNVPTYYFAKDMFMRNPDGDVVSRNIPHCCPVWRRSLHDSVGYFNEKKYKHSADWEFWLRSAKKGHGFFHIRKPLAIYRIVAESHNRVSRRKFSEASNSVTTEYYEDISCTNEVFDFNTQFTGSYGNHRSGWKFVLDNLKPHGNKSRGVIFSSFIERDFGWGFDGILLRTMTTRGWVGIAHAPHKYPQFIADIVDQRPEYYVNKFKYNMVWKRCRGLFTLSEYLAKEWRRLLPGIPVEVLLHPTEIPYVKFSMNKFMHNKKKRVIQIGYWLRKLGSILNLKVSGEFTKTIIRLEITKNVHHISVMWNACIKREIAGEKHLIDFKSWEQSVDQFDTMCNAYDVDVLPRMSDDGYDDALSENIVFFDFYDISASNLLVECIVRNTPILIRRHPATVEYLGSEYPFYFETLEEASRKATNVELIRKTHEYLKGVSNYKYSAENFVNSFFSGEIYKKLKRK